MQSSERELRPKKADMADTPKDRWQLIESLFHAARERAPADREAFLQEACVADPSLHDEVASLLVTAGASFVDKGVDGVLAAGTREPLTGRQLGSYVVGPLLGAGGMGEVYRARDTKLGRDVALKILPASVAMPPDRLSRFGREARLLAALNHPNIAVIHGTEDGHGVYALVLELVEGPTLAEKLTALKAEAKGLPVGVAISIARQIADALDSAHKKGIIHRDLKPANVKLTSDGRVKVLDFGLAKIVTGDGATDLTSAPTMTIGATREGTIVGTAAYMSPEQARGLAVDKRTDIWAFGCVLFELLTGRCAFARDTITDTLAAIVEREPPWETLPATTPTSLVRLLRRCLEKDVNRRFHDIADVRHELEDAGVTPAKTSPRRRWIPTRRALLVTVGVLVLVVGALGYVWWTQAHAPSEPEIKSLAVLPLKSLAADDNYLGMGIADAAIRRVSQTGRVIVRPTSAVRRYLTEDIDALAAAQQLKVDSVLEGSFQRSGDRLRVSVNLLRTRDGASLWADSFDIGTADIFTVQDTVAQQVASHLRLQLDASQKAHLTKRYTSNPDAYEFYLKGTYNFDQRLRDPVRQTRLAIDFYEQAIAADPNFALAHAQLAAAFATRAVFLDPTQSMWVERANEEIRRAERLDPDLADTHLARFQLLYSEFEGYQVEAAAREVLQAIRLNPNVGHHELAYMFNHMGLEDLAVRELSREVEIDPTSDGPSGTAVLMYDVQSRYDDYAADHRIRRESKMDALHLMSNGRLAEAQTVIDEWSKQPNTNELVMTEALLLALKGDYAAAEAQIPVALARHPLKDPLYHHDAYSIACVYAMEGKSAEAVKWLRESAVSGYHLYPRYQRDTFLGRIRQSPEFIQFLAEMKAENDRYRQEFS
jgi:TolB-like protein